MAPKEVASQFPSEGKEGEDSSPPHVTLVYIGNLPAKFEDRLKEVVKNVCDNFKSFDVKLGSPKKLVNDKGQKVFYSPVKSRRLALLHELFKAEFQRNQIPFSNKYPEFKPHITIEYVDPGCKRQYPELCPEGQWKIDSVWIWRRIRTLHVLFKISFLLF